MKFYDSNTELMVLRTVVESQSRGMELLSKLEPSYFGSDVALEIFNRLSIVVGSGRKIPTIDVLKSDDVLSEDSRTFLSAEVNPLDEDQYQSVYETLAKYRKARLLRDHISNTAESLSEESPNLEKVLQQMEQTLSQCRAGIKDDEMFHICESNEQEFMDAIEEDLTPDENQFIPSGFKEFDKKTGGFKRGQVLVLAAPSGAGKSAMMGQMAANQYLMGFNICVISFEMTNEDLRMRMIANISKLNHSDVHVKRLVEQQKELVRNKSKEFVKTGLGNRLTLWGSSEDLDVKDISARTKALGFDIVYIDYIGLLKEKPGENQQKVLGDHVRDCKLASKQNSCVYAPLVQLDEETLKIKYSKAIRANSDFIWAWEKDEKNLEAGVVKVIQQKARSAQEYDFYLACDFSRMAFEDYVGLPPIEENGDKKQVPALPTMNITG